jgi:hypothetical protein
MAKVSATVVDESAVVGEVPIPAQIEIPASAQPEVPVAPMGTAITPAVDDGAFVVKAPAPVVAAPIEVDGVVKFGEGAVAAVPGVVGVKHPLISGGFVNLVVETK